MWHSCEVVALGSQFVGRPRSRELYDTVLQFLEADGPVTVSVRKTRIEFITRARFGGVRPNTIGPRIPPC